MKIFKDAPAPVDQLFLFATCVDDFLCKDDPVRLLCDAIDSLDLTALTSSYRGGGAPGYHPSLLLKVLILGYWQGMRSSRKLEAALHYDMRFMFAAQMSHPDFHTLCRFRRAHEAEIKAVFVQTVQLCKQVGIVLLSHVAVDGTKVEACVAGKHTYSKERLQLRIESIEEQITGILAEAEEVDKAEEASAAKQERLSKELADKRERRKRLLEAKKQMEQTDRDTVVLTDEQSRVMRTRGVNRPAYNAQAAVDGAHSVIIAAEVTQDETDHVQLEPMVEQAKANTGRAPEKVMADSGYWSEQGLSYVEKSGVDAYVAEAGQNNVSDHPGWSYDQNADSYIGPAGEVLPYSRTRTTAAGVTYRIYRTKRIRKEIWRREDAEKVRRMRQKMASEQAREVYKLRKVIVEPVFGHLKESYGLRRLLLRGLSGAKIEYTLACIAHNLSKVVRYGDLITQTAV